MKDFKEIAEKCLAGELSGRFVCRYGLHISSFTLRRTDNPLYPYKLYRVGKLNEEGLTPSKYSQNDIIQFIPYEEMKQEQIKIDIPEGKVPVMEQTESEVVITWKEKELTYDIIKSKLNCYIPSFKFLPTLTSIPFYNKVEALRKLTNIRNYFGEPSNRSTDYGWVVGKDGIAHEAVVEYPHLPVFTKKEHAEQAIKILGDELKFLFEPW